MFLLAAGCKRPLETSLIFPHLNNKHLSVRGFIFNFKIVMKNNLSYNISVWV